MDIPYHIIYIAVIHYNLGDAGFNKKTFQIFQSGSQVNSYNFRAGYDAIAYFNTGEVERILKYLHLGIQFFFIFGIIDTGLDKIIQVYFSKSLVRSFFIDLHPEQTQE